jgi:hypothetical protein
MVVGRCADAFALEGYEDCFAGVKGKEVIACLENGSKVFGSRETDGKGAVDEIEIFFSRVGSVHGLQAYVEEANAVRELRGDVYGLTSDGGESAVVGVRVVGSGDTEC